MDRNRLWAASGTFLLTAACIPPVLAWGNIPFQAGMALAVLAAALTAIGLNYTSTTLRYTHSEIQTVRTADRILRRANPAVRLDKLTSVTYYEKRDLELRLADTDGNVVRIDVSTPWPRVAEWGPIILHAATHAGIPLTDEIREILQRGYGRWTWAY